MTLDLERMAVETGEVMASLLARIAELEQQLKEAEERISDLTYDLDEAKRREEFRYEYW